MALPQPNPGSDWTVETLRQHLVELVATNTRLIAAQAQAAQELRAADQRFEDERDRRYTEVKNAEEKALRIKEQADRDALMLAREIQTYKDEKANELRSQIERERGNYASRSDLMNLAERFEAMLKPVSDYVAVAQGRQGGHADSTRNLVTVIGLVLTAVTVVVGIYLATHRGG